MSSENRSTQAECYGSYSGCAGIYPSVFIYPYLQANEVMVRGEQLSCLSYTRSVWSFFIPASPAVMVQNTTLFAKSIPNEIWKYSLFSFNN